MIELNINNRKDIFDNLILAQNGDIPDDIKINFNDSFSYEFIIKGSKFGEAEEGGVKVPTRILQGVIELQTTLQNAYALSKYGKIQDLTEEEKALTEFNITLEHSHSVKFIFDHVSDSLKNIILMKNAIGITGTLFICAIYATPINTLIESAANIHIVNTSLKIAIIKDSESRYIADRKLEAAQIESGAKKYVADTNLEIAKLQKETMLKSEIDTDGKVKSITLKNGTEESDSERKEFVITEEEYEYFQIINDIANSNNKLKKIQKKCFNAQRSIYESLEDDEICVIDGQSLDNTQIKRLFKEEKEKKIILSEYKLVPPILPKKEEKIFDAEFDIIQINKVRGGFKIKFEFHEDKIGNNYKFALTILRDGMEEGIKQILEKFSVGKPIHLKVEALITDGKIEKAFLISVGHKPDDTTLSH